MSCGQRRVASRQLRDGTGTSRVEVALETVEQLLGLLVAALADAQIGQAGKRAAAQRAVAETPQAHRLGERHVGLGPAAGVGEEAAVVGAAERRNGRKLTPGGDRLAHPDPLIGA